MKYEILTRRDGKLELLQTAGTKKSAKILVDIYDKRNSTLPERMKTWGYFFKPAGYFEENRDDKNFFRES